MEYVTLPNSDLKVSPICLGCWQFNGGEQSKDKTWQAQTEQESKAILDKALEQGINFIDTAEGYLNSEQVVGRILDGRRKDVIIASKFGTRVPKYTAVDIEVSLNKALQNLKTDYIDLYQVHWPTFVADPKECFDELKRQQAKGKIRHYSVCNHGANNLKTALEVGGQPLTNQVSYNMLWRGAEEEIMPFCQEKDIGILAYSPLQQGLLSGKYLKLEDVPEGRRRTRLFNSESTSLSVHGGQGAEKQLFQAIADIKSVCDKAGLSMPVASLSWVLQHDPVKAVVVGASSPEQIERNIKLVKLEQDILKQLDDVTSELKSIFGKNPDLWAKDSRMI